MRLCRARGGHFTLFNSQGGMAAFILLMSCAILCRSVLGDEVATLDDDSGRERAFAETYRAAATSRNDAPHPLLRGHARDHVSVNLNGPDNVKKTAKMSVPGPERRELQQQAVELEPVRFGDLEVAAISKVRAAWLDYRTGAKLYLVIYEANLTPAEYSQGWRVLGQFSRPSYNDIRDVAVTIVARNVNSSNPVLAPPVDYEWIWNESGSGTMSQPALMLGSVWRPLPAQGFVCLGDVFVASRSKPMPGQGAMAAHVCVRADYAKEAAIGDFVWDDRGSHATFDCSIWRSTKDVAFFSPAIGHGDFEQGWRVLSQVAVPHYQPIGGLVATIVARNVDASVPVLKSPVGFAQMWTDQGSGAHLHGSVWRPIPPTGYVCLSDIVVDSWAPPAPGVGPFVCVALNPAIANHSYAREAKFAGLIWDDRGSGAACDVTIHGIEMAQYPPDEKERLSLLVNGFLAGTIYDNNPSATPYLLELPPIVYRPPVADPRPNVTSHDMPFPPDTPKVVDNIVVVPCTIVSDNNHTAAWQVLNSPFYKMERGIYYHLEVHSGGANISAALTVSQQVTFGIITKVTEEFTVRTHIEASVAAGIGMRAKLGPLKLSVGPYVETQTSITKEIGYSKRYEVTEFSETTLDWTVETKPFHSVSLWSHCHEIVLLRHNGDPVADNAGMLININNHRLVVEYPSS
ncbi:hypothetical protein CBR_g53601 [Chara braunii]|uniref:Uncharacterized protein n=1 Tax=Chara braunii TaxID=69332 RepID=A0A388MBC0_CHABU|nr:hypothetical protein CBR_g53601 [Chara braunii]|eukprot:GBG91749.1 hypothetical protein CBR_g53601 [Chara braunii]